MNTAINSRFLIDKILFDIILLENSSIEMERLCVHLCVCFMTHGRFKTLCELFAAELSQVNSTMEPHSRMPNEGIIM